jgi:hypothetical protein
VPQDLLAHLDQRIGTALPGGAVVAHAVAGGAAAGQRFQDGQERLAVLAAEPEPAAQRSVLIPAVLQEPAFVRPGQVVLQNWFAVRREQVRHPVTELHRVHRRGDLDQLRLHLHQRRRIDPVDQPGQHRRLRRGQHPVQHRGRHQRQAAQQPGGAQLRPGRAGGRVLHLSQPPRGRAGPAAVLRRHGPTGQLRQLPGGDLQPALQPGDLRRHRHDPRLQPHRVQRVQRLSDQHVHQRRQHCRPRYRRRPTRCCHDTNLAVTSDTSRTRERL